MTLPEASVRQHRENGTERGYDVQTRDAAILLTTFRNLITETVGRVSRQTGTISIDAQEHMVSEKSSKPKIVELHEESIVLDLVALSGIYKSFVARPSSETEARKQRIISKIAARILRVATDHITIDPFTVRHLPELHDAVLSGSSVTNITGNIHLDNLGESMGIEPTTGDYMSEAQKEIREKRLVFQRSIEEKIYETVQPELAKLIPGLYSTVQFCGNGYIAFEILSEKGEVQM